jgi:hypothetical protein
MFRRQYSTNAPSPLSQTRRKSDHTYSVARARYISGRLEDSQSDDVKLAPWINYPKRPNVIVNSHQLRPFVRPSAVTVRDAEAATQLPKPPTAPASSHLKPPLQPPPTNDRKKRIATSLYLLQDC